jgi:hypothetical protein
VLVVLVLPLLPPAAWLAPLAVVVVFAAVCVAEGAAPLPEELGGAAV